jgi:hypothetical protein
MTLAGKIRECTRVINFWKKHADEPGAESRTVFEKALRGHLALAKETGEEICPEILKAAEQALA